MEDKHQAPRSDVRQDRLIEAIEFYLRAQSLSLKQIVVGAMLDMDLCQLFI